MKILITGARGFVGKNLSVVLRLFKDVELFEYDLVNSAEELDQALTQVDLIFHLAGVNRPEDPSEFETGNAGALQEICQKLKSLDRRPKIVLSSSIQAEMENPYGISKRNAEDSLKQFSMDTGAASVVYRLKNLFGKWCRPNYNSVVATFCHNIANDKPIQISNPANEVDLTHIDEVVEAFVSEIDKNEPGFHLAEPLPSVRITLGQLVEKLQIYKNSRTTLHVPDYRSPFERALYSTFLSYLAEDKFDYGLDIKSDQRGSLAEFIKSPALGQVFVSRTHPGIVRGDHYHHTKTEKFLVLEGEAVIRFRHIESNKVLTYTVRGDEYRVVDIPPGYTHSIENIGDDVLVTLFWASEVFDPQHPDTFFDPVQGAPTQ